MSGTRLSARAAARLVRIGQRWQHRKTKEAVVIYQVHRAERRVEAYPEGADPRLPRTRFYVSFAELGSRYAPADGRESEAA